MKRNLFITMVAAACLGMMIASCSESPTDPKPADPTATPTTMPTATATPTFAVPTSQIKIAVTGTSQQCFVGYGDSWGNEVQVGMVALPWETTITIGHNQCPGVGGGFAVLDGGNAKITIYENDVEIGSSPTYTKDTQPETPYIYQIPNVNWN